MKYNGTTVPTTRDNTYNSEEIHRKDDTELFETAFNKDQKTFLMHLADVLDGIRESIRGILPSVSSDDNGKVLTVVDGAWDKAPSSGGGGDVATILQWEGTLTDDYQTIDVADFGKVVVGMAVSEDPTKRDFWNLVCEYAGELAVAEGESETLSQFAFPSTGAYASISFDNEEGTVNAMGHTEDGDPIDVTFYSIF